MSKNDRAGFFSQWASDVYQRLGNIQDSSDENISLGRVRREKILASLAAIEREKEHGAEDGKLAQKRIDALKKGIAVDLEWLNTHGFPASLNEGKLLIEGLDADEE